MFGKKIWTIRCEIVKEIPMPLSQEKISKLRVQSFEFAEEIMKQILEAFHRPQVSLSGEALKICNEFEDWGFLEDYPIDDITNHTMYRRIIAMTQFRHLRWEAEHPQSGPKLSKWEKVTGKVSRK